MLSALQKILRAIFGSKQDRDIKRILPLVDKINGFEAAVKELSEEQMKAQTAEFKKQLQEGTTLKELLPEAFALVREAAVRTLGERHYDVQLMGGIALHEGNIAEMKTGEGKTLTSTLALYLNGLTGKGCHVVTVNEYLVKRDSEWMGQIFKYLGLTVGHILNEQSQETRREMYACDITYGTTSEFGFDYLRDNMVVHRSHKVQGQHYFAIVDEVDSVLIDEARTPLVISGPAEVSTELYYKIDKLVRQLKPTTKTEEGKWDQQAGDFAFEEKDKMVMLTEAGVKHVERMLGLDNLFAGKNVEIVHHVNQALKAHIAYNKDVEYVVEEGKVVIIDENTGRKLPGRRFSEGLHQALEAKEKLVIERETQTLASITLQNLFRIYDKLAGMTGTADTEATEFRNIYNLDVVVIPTNVPCRRQDYNEKIFKTEKEKYQAIFKEIEACHRKGQPVLVGTISVDKSEYLSKILKKRGMKHNVLNAKYHDMEAQIIKNAGQLGAITISTNMAGRGTDIKLGKGVPEIGGLHIIGTERHESRRIDNQLRGRSGRQGDPGSSRFYISLEDPLMRMFGNMDRIGMIMDRLGLEEGQEIEHKWISNAIERAQKRVEMRNFEARKHLLEYDDVMNRQRVQVYALRNRILYEDTLFDEIRSYYDMIFADFLDTTIQGRGIGTEDVEGIYINLNAEFGVEIPPEKRVAESERDDFLDQLINQLDTVYADKEQQIGENILREIEKIILLRVLDKYWKMQLHRMDELKGSIYLRSYAQSNPLIEYKREGSLLFDEMMFNLKREVLQLLFRVEPSDITFDDEYANRKETMGRTEHDSVAQFQVGNQTMRRDDKQPGQANKPAPIRRASDKVGRNDPCPCGSGKKYKNCHGKKAG